MMKRKISTQTGNSVEKETKPLSNFPNGDRGLFRANTKVKGKKNVQKNRATSVESSKRR